MIILRCWLILAALMLPGTIYALSLNEALEVSRDRATTLKKLAAETRRAEALHQQSAQAYFPVVSADASWLRADATLINDIPVPTIGLPPIQYRSFGPVEGTVTGIQVVQPLFNADAIQASKRAALNVDARRYAEQWGHQAIRLEVTRRYFNVIRQQEREGAAEMSRRAARKSARLAQASYEEGLVSRLDTEQAAAQLAAAQARCEQAAVGKRQAELELKSLLGIAPEKEIALSSPLPEPAAPLGIGASRPRKDLEARKTAVEAAIIGTRARKSEWLPRVNLLARRQWLDGNDPVDFHEKGWLVMLNLQWTIFDGFGRQGRIAESLAEEQKARVELDEMHRRIQQEQAIAMNLWEASWAGWHAGLKATQAARRAARLALRRYEEGLGSMTDLLMSQARLDRERLSLINARYQAVLAATNYHLQHGYDPILPLEGRLP